MYSPLKLDLVCPIAVRPSEVFYCWVKFHEGSDIQSLQWKLDGANDGAAITSVGGESMKLFRKYPVRASKRVLYGAVQSISERTSKFQMKIKIADQLAIVMKPMRNLTLTWHVI